MSLLCLLPPLINLILSCSHILFVELYLYLMRKFHCLISWLPDHVTLLARFAGEPTPVKSTVTKAVAEFRRTHADTWNIQKDLFTEEQLEVYVSQTDVFTRFCCCFYFSNLLCLLYAGSGWYIFFIFIFCLIYIVIHSKEKRYSCTSVNW